MPASNVMMKIFAELTEREHIIPALYMVRNKWVHVEKSKCIEKERVGRVCFEILSVGGFETDKESAEGNWNN